MKNFVQKGDAIVFTAAANVASGDLVAVGDLVGVAVADVLNGQQGVMYIEGVYEVPKLAADNMTHGSLLYFDVSEGELTLTSTDNVKAGYAFEAAGASTATVKVKLER